jgi:hypothetical protein
MMHSQVVSPAEWEARALDFPTVLTIDQLPALLGDYVAADHVTTQVGTQRRRARGPLGQSHCRRVPLAQPQRRSVQVERPQVRSGSPTRCRCPSACR